MESRNSNCKQLRHGLKDSLNKHEWTPELDTLLRESVIRNYFNFEQVSLEVNRAAQQLHLSFGATNVYTNEKCRLRWSYLHFTRKEHRPIRYKESAMAASA